MIVFRIGMLISNVNDSNDSYAKQKGIYMKIYISDNRGVKWNTLNPPNVDLNFHIN